MTQSVLFSQAEIKIIIEYRERKILKNQFEDEEHRQLLLEELEQLRHEFGLDKRVR